MSPSAVLVELLTALVPVLTVLISLATAPGLRRRALKLDAETAALLPVGSEARVTMDAFVERQVNELVAYTEDVRRWRLVGLAVLVAAAVVFVSFYLSSIDEVWSLALAVAVSFGGSLLLFAMAGAVRRRHRFGS